MRMILILAVSIALPLWADEKKADSTGLKGKWEVTAASFNGNESPALKGRVLEFTDSEFTTYDGDKKGRTIAFKADATTKPKTIDLLRGSDDVKALGIYEIEKDELKICYAEPGADRPTKFESAAGSKVFLLVLKGAK
jgi:uncharacterized protein (TIGR03067 family)